jgi:hypothetical protein
MPAYKEMIKVTIVVIEKRYIHSFRNILLSRLTAYVEELNEDQM